MKETKSMTKDPICGMTVDESSALYAERDGKTFYFCGEHCRKKFCLRQKMPERERYPAVVVAKNS